MHVFLFDIDGTLIQSGGAGKAALHDAMLEQFHVEQPADVPIHGCTDRSIARELFAQHGIENTDGNWQKFRAAYLQHLPRWLARKDGQILPGVTTLLDRLSRRADTAVGLLTGNVLQGARIKLDYFGLVHHFRFGGYGDQHHARDDVARDAFRAANKKYNGQVTPERTYVIGDTPNDIRCARAIGVRVVAVATGFYDTGQLEAEQPDWLLQDLTELSEISLRLTMSDE